MIVSVLAVYAQMPPDVYEAGGTWVPSYHWAAFMSTNGLILVIVWFNDGFSRRASLFLFVKWYVHTTYHIP